MAKREERGIAIPFGSGALALEGLFVAAAPDAGGGAVVAPPHPLYGGSMDSPVVGEVAWACERTGMASLRFNWRGVGASGGERSGDAADADADYASALTLLAETVEGPLLAAGYSFGAAAAARAAIAEPRVRRLVLVSPPPSLLEPAALRDFRGATLIVTGERDDLAPASALATLAGEVGARFEAIPEADHFFVAGLAAISRAVGAWLGR